MNISAIIVEYQNLVILREAVQSILNQISDVPFEIIIVSNSSYSPDKQIEIKSNFPETTFIFNQENLGFAKAVNQGIRKSCGEFVLLLNPDSRLLDKSLCHAIKSMHADSHVAIIGPKIVDNAGKIQDSCRQFMGFKVLLKRIVLRILKSGSENILEKKDYSKTHYVGWVSGACMLVRKAAIDDVGLMDERYFMYAEDMDWCRNFYNHSWQVCYLPDWTVEHNAGRGSSGRFGLSNKLMWIHISSLCKYYAKWALSKK